MDTLPEGTVTFLFTDVAGSTRLWEEHPDAAGAALVRHDALIEGLVARHDGAVVRPRGEGDSRFAVFPRATDALAAAAAILRAFDAEPWPMPTSLRVRLALHTGEADLRAGDYYGTAVNRCARLRALAHPDQALLSLAAQELVRDALPPGVTLRDLGEHYLKDLARPERVFQLVVEGLPGDFPPLPSLGHRPTNLPVQPTPLVGREREVGETVGLLRNPEVRLVTLTGPGGIGKTRLALQVAAEALKDYPDGAWFVDLASLVDPALVLPTVARVLGLMEAGGEPLADTLRRHLGDKRLLLVLDNFEQVVAAAPLVAGVLAVAPGLRALATSRVPLRLRGEREYPVPPLSLPDPRRPPPVERLGQYAAARLFIERAVAVRPDFVVTNATAGTIATICHRLDGLPLAIELAAARIRLLGPQQLLARLERRLGVLTGGQRDLPHRQQTLRATIEWSYQLLDAGEQALFRRLAVFVGARSLEAVEAVCNADGDLPLDVLDGAESLVAKNLLRLEEGVGGEPRFVMLETIHEYARERLEQSAEAEAQRRAHAEYFLALAEGADPQLQGPEQVAWLAWLEAEYDNLRAVLGWALEREEAEMAARLGGELWRFWLVRGHLSEGRRWLGAALECSGPVAPAVRAKAFNGAGSLAYQQGDYPAARALYVEFLALCRKLGDKRGVGAALGNLGIVAHEQGDYPAARALYEESLALARELGHKNMVANALNNLGNVSRDQEDYAVARARNEAGLALARELGDKGGIASFLTNLGSVAFYQGDYDAARALHEESLALLRELGDKRGIAECLEGLAALHGAQGQVAQAAKLWGAAEALRETLGVPLPPADRLASERHLAAARARLDPATFAAAWAEGRALLLEEVIADVLADVPQPVPAAEVG